MTKQKLLELLRKLQESHDPEVAHNDADGLLLDFIDDKEIAEAFYAVPRWYA